MFSIGRFAATGAAGTGKATTEAAGAVLFAIVALVFILDVFISEDEEATGALA